LNGEVILYADVRTQSIQKFLAVSAYRREKQVAYNKEHNITPRSISRAIEEGLVTRPTGDRAAAAINESGADFDVTETLRELEEEMLAAANNLEFEKAALVRDQIRELKRTYGSQTGQQPAKERSVGYGRGKRRRVRA
jgi:excinuclease ABC subunit B